MRKTVFKKLESEGLIANYNRFRKNSPPRLPKRVFFWDESLREGERTPATFLTYVEKVRLAKMIDEMGASIINIGFPGFSEESKNAVRRISNENFVNARLAASARTAKTDIDACLGCGISLIAVFTAFNELSLRHRLRTTKERVLERTANSIEYARDHGMPVAFVLEDASRTPLEEILQVFQIAVSAGASLLVVADTVGFLRPLSTRYILARIRKELSLRDVDLSVRCHNDFGLATANTLAAAEEGVKYPQTCAAGFGARAGLAPMEEVAAALEILYNVDTGVNMKKLHRLAQLAEKSFALPLPLHKSITGEYAFSQSLDEGTMGMMVDPMVSGSFPPKMLGRDALFYIRRQTGREFVEGRLSLSGIQATPKQVDEIVRIVRRKQESLDKGEMLMAFYQIKRLMRELRRGLTEEDFWGIVEAVTGQKPSREGAIAD